MVLGEVEEREEREVNNGPGEAETGPVWGGEDRGSVWGHVECMRAWGCVAVGKAWVWSLRKGASESWWKW